MHNAKMLTPEEFASLLAVGNTFIALEPPAVIPAEHRARLVELGYVTDMAGRLRITTLGSERMEAGYRSNQMA